MLECEESRVRSKARLEHEAGEKAQGVKCLSYNHEDVSVVRS